MRRVSSLSVKARDVLRQRVAKKLQDMKLRPADFARKMERSQAWASGFLKGEKSVPLETVDQISHVLDMPLPELFTELAQAGNTDVKVALVTADDVSTADQGLSEENVRRAMSDRIQGNNRVAGLVGGFIQLNDQRQRRALNFIFQLAQEELSPPAEGTRTTRKNN
jgi:transcriptional regulator with XRE-family HTH domain